MTQATPPPPGTPGPPDSPPAGAGVSKDARTWGMFAHLAALAGYLGVPFGHVAGPLVVWLIKKDEHPFVNDQGKESLNFQITVTIALAVCIPLIFLFCIGIPLLIAVGIGNLIFVIVGAVKANEGVAYRYPISIRLIK